MVGIVAYGAGNIFSLSVALDRLDAPYEILQSPEQLRLCTRIIIPGVGHAAKAMESLANGHWVKPLRDCKKPVLGICLGMQLLTEFSEEGDSSLLNIVPLSCRQFAGPLKIPHMGWNALRDCRGPLFEGVPEGSYVYFVHSYYAAFKPSFTTATTDYGLPFSAAIQRDNFYGVQFHPEKSGLVGQTILNNFLRI